MTMDSAPCPDAGPSSAVPPSWATWESRWLAAPVLLMGVVYVALGFFAFPAADDFGYALGGRGTPWSTQVGLYLGWSGRYTANLLLTLVPQLVDLVRWYWVVPVGHLALLWLALVALLSSLFSGRLWSRRAVVPAGLLLLVYLAGLETLYEGFYWFSGAVTYQLGVALWLLTLALLFWNPPVRRRPWQIAAIVAVGLVGGGTSEVVALLAVATLAFVVGWHWRFGVPVPKRWLAALGVWAVAAAVVMVAPGNAVRARVMLHYMAPSWIACTYGLYVVERSMHWLLSPATVGIGLLWFCWLPSLACRFPLMRSVRAVHVLLAGLLWIGLPALGAVPSFVFTEIEPAPRVGNVLYAFFLAGFLGFVTVGGCWLWEHRELRSRDLRPARVLGVLIVALGLLGWPWSNLPSAAADLWYRARPYKAQQLRRIELIRAARAQGQPTVELPSLQSPPASLHGYDLESYEWIRRAYARYFGLEDVSIRQGGPK